MPCNVRRVQVIVGTSLGFIYGAHAPKPTEKAETETATDWAETAKPSQSLRQQPTPKVRLAPEIGDR